MNFVRCFFLTLCLGATLSFVAPNIAPARHVHAQQTAPQTVPPPQNAPQAYQLSPEKQAKAIAISRIRNILDIVGGLWGLAVLWLLLSTRAAAGLEGWAKRISARRWIQGLIFSPLSCSSPP